MVTITLRALATKSIAPPIPLTRGGVNLNLFALGDGGAGSALRAVVISVKVMVRQTVLIEEYPASGRLDFEE